MIRPWQLTLTASIALFGIGNVASSTEWTPVEAKTPNEEKGSISVPIRWKPLETEPSTSSKQPQWQELNIDPDLPLKERVKWVLLEASEAADIEKKIENETPIENQANTAVAIQPPVMPSGTTFANDKAIWRDEEWHPQISGIVPVGFGPKGLMISTSTWGIDCITGAGYCANTNSFDEYIKQVERLGEAQYNLSIGIGNSEEFAGLTITSRFEETGLPLGSRNKTEGNNLFSNYYIGTHLSRSLSQDTAIKIGIDNWLDIRDCINCGFAKSAYGVISQRFRLRKNQNSIAPNLYLTFGIGNGQFRPLDEQARDGIRKQKDAGCATAGYTPEIPCSKEASTRAELRARSYGQINPIGALALEAFPGTNIIGEWSGRNLNAGFSIRPFEEFGLILTAMWENILPNCDYGCTIYVPGVPEGIEDTGVPNGLTQRPRFSIQASLELRF